MPVDSSVWFELVSFVEIDVVLAQIVAELKNCPRTIDLPCSSHSNAELGSPRLVAVTTASAMASPMLGISWYLCSTVLPNQTT